MKTLNQMKINVLIQRFGMHYNYKAIKVKEEKDQKHVRNAGLSLSRRFKSAL